MDGPDGGPGRGGRGRGRGRGGRGRGDGGGGRGRGGARRPDPTPCPLGVDEEGRLKIKITCMIMRDFAGAVIGRGGEHVTDIRKESGALVHVCKPDFETGIQGVDLYGTLDQVTSAQAKLAAILNAHAGEWCHDKNWGARVRLQLLPDVASVVIGKKGSTVQRISKDSGAVVRVGNDVDASNLQLCQIFGNNDQAAAAVVLLMDALREYDAGSSRSIPRLKDQWESRRQAEMYPPPDGGYPGGSGGPGGPSPSRDRYNGGSNRYEPYPRRGPGGGSGAPDQYGGPGGHGGPPMHGGDSISPSPMVVMPGGMQAPNIPGQMPTVLIQQADGTLVQAQVVTQAGGQYAVQAATSAQAAVQVLKSGYGISQPLSMPTQPGAAAPAPAPAPQPAMHGAPPGQVLVQGPNGMMYATAASAPAGAAAPVAPSGGSDRGGGAPSAQQYAVAPPASQYQVQAAGPPVAAAGQQVADPMAYNKLAGYGQQGAGKAPSAPYNTQAAPQQQQPQQAPQQQAPQQQQQQIYSAQPGAAYGHSVSYGGAPMAQGQSQYPGQYSAPAGGQYK